MAAARKLAFVGPKAMLFGMPVAEKPQSAMGLQYRLDDRHLRPCLSYVPLFTRPDAAITARPRW